MIYENIQGWFNYEDLFDMMIDRFDEAVFVEIGAWKGKSAAYMGERIKDTGKNIKYYVIDHFKGNRDSDLHKNDEDIINKTLYKTFLKNIDPLIDYINVIKCSSNQGCIMFNNRSIDFLFIDGTHTYRAVKKDIKLWLPKVKKIIAGHDYYLTGVNRAVNELIPNHKVIGDSWYAEN